MNTIKIKNMGNVCISKYHRKDNNICFDDIGTISINELKNIIINFDYLSSFLKFENEMNIYSVKAINLLSPLNYDIFIKYLYFKNIDNDYIKKMYLKHIKIFNNYKEPDGSKKNKTDFLNSTKKLVLDFENGFDSSKSIVPISNQNIIIDGSHRIALSIIKNQKVSCIKFDTEDLLFDFRFFQKRGFSQEYLDLVGFSIIELVDNISCLVFEYNNKSIIDMMYANFDVYYYKKVSNKIIFLFSNTSMEFYLNKKIIIGTENIYNEYINFIKKKIVLRYNNLN